MRTPPTGPEPSRMAATDASILLARALAAPEGRGATIDRYQLIEEIGAGGFGTVFLAEQIEPVERQVALKIIKVGMDTRHVIARFEQERQTLALMDHPHIAKVLDAGTTDAGRPYFVMELVDGEPITSFCDLHELSVRERLELFVQVGNAIQHAHQKGTIHRDIKPSNILVSTHDGRPHAKVIDFGIAKAIEQPFGAETMHTRVGQWIGTPLYTSPEQSVGSLDVDTRSDVYSLGVLLYELLTGTTPFTATRDDSSSIYELQRLLREVDPPRPSMRVSTATETLPLLAAARSTEPRQLLSLLRGELDWITMKAIEKDPERRYQTANAFVLDIERYLAGEPVVAAPASTSYRLRKLVARHRGAVLAATVVTLALFGGLAGTLWQARAAAAERDLARKEAARAIALNDFMRQMLTASNPEVQGSRETTVAEVLTRASGSATRTLANEPDAEAEARLLLGETFRSLGWPDEALVELERAVALRDGSAGSDPVAHSRALRGLAMAHRDRGEVDEALALYGRADSLLPVESADGAVIDERISLEYALALGLTQASRWADAERHLDVGELLVDRLPGEQPVWRGSFRTARAVIAQDWKGDLEAAERLNREALELQRRGGEPHQIADAASNLGLILNSRQKRDEAISLFEEAIAINRKIYGDRHPEVAVTLENLANVHWRQGKHDLALALLDETLAIRASAFGDQSLPAARTRFNMGVLASESGDHARAFELLDTGLAIFREQYGERSIEAAIGFFYRAATNEALGHTEAALADYTESLAILDTLGNPAEPTRLSALHRMARLECRQGAVDRGRATIHRARRALDASNTDHQVWIERFEQTLASCGG